MMLGLSDDDAALTMYSSNDQPALMTGLNCCTDTAMCIAELVITVVMVAPSTGVSMHRSQCQQHVRSVVTA